MIDYQARPVTSFKRCELKNDEICGILQESARLRVLPVFGSDGGSDASQATDAAIETKTGNNQEVKIEMPKFKELDSKVTLAEQMQMSGGPIVLINVFTIDPGDEEALINAWSHDADFMKTQPGYISTQLHRGIGGSTTYINYAIWESVEAFRNAFTNPSQQAYEAITQAGCVVFPCPTW
jgi:heme-degrading monooxygenase HmoA